MIAFVKRFLSVVLCLFMLTLGFACNKDKDDDPAVDKNEEKTVEDYIDFFVDVPTGRNPVVLQLTDPQIADGAQARTKDRINQSLKEFWSADNFDALVGDYTKEIVEATNPDLILVTGDIIYGEFDDNGSMTQKYVQLMESLGVPWAPILGNHDAELAMGVDWLCQQFENAENCLFKQRELMGNGNYNVAIRQGGEVKRVFFMLDSNGASNAHENSIANGHTPQTVGIFDDQIEWYEDTAKNIIRLCPRAKIAFAYHIPSEAFSLAALTYNYFNYKGCKNVNIFNSALPGSGDFGLLTQPFDCWDITGKVFNSMKDLGCDLIMVGHEHSNSASIMYEGVRLQFGQKSSLYDSTPYVNPATYAVKGEYVGASSFIPLVGGSVIELSMSSGSIENAYIQYCSTAGAQLDKSKFN